MKVVSLTVFKSLWFASAFKLQAEGGQVELITSPVQVQCVQMGFSKVMIQVNLETDVGHPDFSSPATLFHPSALFVELPD